MARSGHGDEVQAADIGALPRSSAFAAKNLLSDNLQQPHFGYMFSADARQRPDSADRLPEDPDIVAKLDALGTAMGHGGSTEPDATEDRVLPGDGTIPAGYTYFGQFVDHDITVASGGNVILADVITPLTSLDGITNARTPLLELDSVYGHPSASPNPVPSPVGKKMIVGNVTVVGSNQQNVPFLFVPGKSLANDLPRKPRSTDPLTDREARIGDPRNDENLIIAQLHVAFLKAHNALADQSGSFEEARSKLTLMYQSAIWDDFLMRICEEDVVRQIEDKGPRFFTAASPLFMPIEFSAAAFRFGHSMVRENYDFNLNFSPAGSLFMFTFTALSGNLAPNVATSSAQGSDTFPHNWIIEWDRFLEVNGSTPQRARPIDAHLTPILATLRDTFGKPMTGNIAPHLARRNLRRGFWFSLPTGQAVAARIGVPPIEISASELGLDASAVAPFIEKTPLWFYILAEAQKNGGKLGVVGSTIVAETFHTLISRSKPSIFDSFGGRVSSARHKLTDIIQLAGMQD